MRFSVQKPPASWAAFRHRRAPHPPQELSPTQDLGLWGAAAALPGSRPSPPVPDLTLRQEKEASRTKWSRTLTQAGSEPVRAAIRSKGVARGGRTPAFRLALRPRGPLVAGHQRTARILRWNRDGELCPSLAPGCLLGAVVFLPAVVLGSLQETITSFSLAAFPRLCGWLFQAHCMTGGFLHLVTVWQGKQSEEGTGLRVI